MNTPPEQPDLLKIDGELYVVWSVWSESRISIAIVADWLTSLWTARFNTARLKARTT